MKYYFIACESELLGVVGCQNRQTGVIEADWKGSVTAAQGASLFELHK